MADYALAIHGGAGTLRRADMHPDQERRYHAALQEALMAGQAILNANGSAIDAVEAAVVSLEDCPLFNAGRGSVFTHEGTHEMDAAIMSGSNLAAGAVAGITGIRNPVRLAHAVMNQTEHVMLAGEGAMRFARQQGFSIEPPEYFFTEQRHAQWLAMRDSDTSALDHNVSVPDDERKLGTVGAVARDKLGNLAAATSTGGMTNKRWGRIGDTPVIGAGCYANNRTCAISSTGHGEWFIKAVAAYDVSCLMAYRGLTLQQAMEVTVMDTLKSIGGEGGMIGVSATGEPVMLFNSEGMYRGFVTAGKEPVTAIYER